MAKNWCQAQQWDLLSLSCAASGQGLELRTYNARTHMRAVRTCSVPPNILAQCVKLDRLDQSEQGWETVANLGCSWH